MLAATTGICCSFSVSVSAAVLEPEQGRCIYFIYKLLLTLNIFIKLTETGCKTTCKLFPNLRQIHNCRCISKEWTHNTKGTSAGSEKALSWGFYVWCQVFCIADPQQVWWSHRVGKRSGPRGGRRSCGWAQSCKQFHTFSASDADVPQFNLLLLRFCAMYMCMVDVSQAHVSPGRNMEELEVGLRGK